MNRKKGFWWQLVLSIVLGVVVVTAGYLGLLFIWLLYEFIFGK